MAMDDRVHLEDDVSPAAWIAPRLHPFGQDTGSVIPEGFDADCRIFHPEGPNYPNDSYKTWAEVAAEERSHRPLGDAVPHDQSGARKSRTGAREFDLRTGRGITSPSPEDRPH